MAGAKMSKQQLQADICIAGGGLVGALTALLVARAHPAWQIMVIEPQDQGPAVDKRTIALAAGTVELLQQQQLWTPLQAAATPITHIHVSDRGFIGNTTLHAEQEGVAALGQVVTARVLNQILYDACQQQDNIDWCGGAAVQKVVQQPEQIQVALDNGAKVSARLLVGADGQKSQVRQQLKIDMQRTDYQQMGIVARLSLAQDLDGWAYERFTETGPIALLPVQTEGSEAGAAALVWSVRPDTAAALQEADEATFLHACQAAFGYRAGAFVGVQNRAAFPLQLQLAVQSTSHRAVLIGNASHALHPIAGQGFNLGVRDVLALLQVLSEAEDPGAYPVLRKYWQAREQDYKHTIGLTEWLVHGFSNKHAALVPSRNLALLALDNIGPLKRKFAKQAMGKG